MIYKTFSRSRPLSWSSMSLFDEQPYCDPEKWYQKYVIHQDCTRSKLADDGITMLQAFCAITGIADDSACPQNESSREMEFGSLIDKRLQVDPKFLPHVPRYQHMQYPLKGAFNSIPLIGFPDGLEIDPSYVLADYKTGKAPWTQKKADTTGQLTMYLLLLFIIKGIRPEEFECRIHWLPTQDNSDFSIGLIDDTDMKTFYTNRTMSGILEFGVRIKRVYAEMEEYCKNHV